MPREAAPSLNERAFVVQALSEGARLDGRALDEIRWPELSFGSEYGSVEVRMGKTRVHARISVDTTTPYPDRKFEGIFTIAAELSPMASASFESGGSSRTSETEALLARSLDKSLRRSAALDTESLCLIAGRLAFQLTLTLHVLSLDGGLFDAALCAATAALAHARLPATHVVGTDVRIFSPAERVPVPLALHHRPYSVTWTIFAAAADGTEGGVPGSARGSARAGTGAGADAGTGAGAGAGAGASSAEGTEARAGPCVADATQLEAQCGAAELLVAANRDGEVVQAAKLGGAPADAVSLLVRAEASLPIVREIARRVDEALARDAARREKGGASAAEASAENER